MYIEKDLIFYDYFLHGQEELFDVMADELEKKNYVTEGFREAIKKREKEFPTGLKLRDLNVAIVHVDASFSRTEKIVVFKLGKPITFQNIEDLQPIEVKIIFGLVLNDSAKHLEVLQKVSNLLQNEKAMQSLQETKSKVELLSVMKKYFNEKEN